MSDHHHTHNHLRSRAMGRLQIAAVLTFVLLIVEAVAGLVSNSLALLSDAGHMLTDLIALLLILLSIHWATRPASKQKTFGYYRLEILASLFNGILLIFVALQIILEAGQRMMDPRVVTVSIMLPVAIGGFIVNLIATLLLHTERSHIATRSAFYHVVSDLLSSVGVIAAGLLIHRTGIYVIDPLISFGIAFFILFGSYRLLRETVDILLEATPGHIPLDQVREEILSVAGVEDVHDLHVWTISSGFHAASAHISVYPMNTRESDVIVSNIREKLRTRFAITHTTLQTESLPAPATIEPMPTH